jgi:hypothetical protein
LVASLAKVAGEANGLRFFLSLNLLQSRKTVKEELHPTES